MHSGIQLVVLFFIYIYAIFALYDVGNLGDSGNSTLIRNIIGGIGGPFAIQTFLNGLKKKYGKNNPGSPSGIEVEIKLKCDATLAAKIAKWIKRRSDAEVSDTINRIWNNPKVIETTTNNGCSSCSMVTWHTKDRLIKYDLHIGDFAGKLTVAIENELAPEEIPQRLGEPDLIRQKNRISSYLDKSWRIDCTWIGGDMKSIPEIEIEYIALDYWNAVVPNQISFLSNWLSRFN